ncbi:hypothetical protein [Stygiolobus caldivivus]|nr:hypothetical protein [Stygiolobus caldivivus]
MAGAEVRVGHATGKRLSVRDDLVAEKEKGEKIKKKEKKANNI